MPQIIVTADQSTDGGQPPVMLRERVSVSDFESEHFGAQLLERLGWAVGDADEVDRRGMRRSVRRAGERASRRRILDAAQRELAAGTRTTHDGS